MYTHELPENEDFFKEINQHILNSLKDGGYKKALYFDPQHDTPKRFFYDFLYYFEIEEDSRTCISKENFDKFSQLLIPYFQRLKFVPNAGSSLSHDQALLAESNSILISRLFLIFYYYGALDSLNVEDIKKGVFSRLTTQKRHIILNIYSDSTNASNEKSFDSLLQNFQKIKDDEKRQWIQVFFLLESLSSNHPYIKRREIYYKFIRTDSKSAEKNSEQVLAKIISIILASLNDGNSPFYLTNEAARGFLYRRIAFYSVEINRHLPFYKKIDAFDYYSQALLCGEMQALNPLVASCNEDKARPGFLIKILFQTALKFPQNQTIIDALKNETVNYKKLYPSDEFTGRSKIISKFFPTTEFDIDFEKEFWVAVATHKPKILTILHTINPGKFAQLKNQLHAAYDKNNKAFAEYQEHFPEFSKAKINPFDTEVDVDSKEPPALELSELSTSDKNSDEVPSKLRLGKL